MTTYLYLQYMNLLSNEQDVNNKVAAGEKKRSVTYCSRYVYITKLVKQNYKSLAVRTKNVGMSNIL